MLLDGLLFAGVLGHVHDEHMGLSASFGGPSVFQRTPPQLRASVRPSPPPDGAQHTYLFFDGASRNKQGPAAGDCVLRASDGIGPLVQDSEFLK